MQHLHITATVLFKSQRNLNYTPKDPCLQKRWASEIKELHLIGQQREGDPSDW